MILRPAREADFPHLETFVWQAIFPAFDRVELTADQRAENDALVENARAEVLSALEERNTAIFVAIDPTTRTLAGYLIADGAPQAYAEVRRLIVKRSLWGKGVAASLLAEATNFIGPERAVSVAVRFYNARALAFFAKHGFENTGETTGNFAIPRALLLREALEEIHPAMAKPSTSSSSSSHQWEEDFPTGADEPVFESLPDYNLRVEETPLFPTGSNALTTADEDEFMGGDSSLTDDQLTELEAFIARARAKKGTTAPVDNQPTPPPSATPLRTSIQQERATVRTTYGAGKQRKNNPVAAKFDRSKITFEVDFGDGRLEPLEDQPTSKNPRPGKTTELPTEPATKPSFEFAFGDTSEVEQKTTEVTPAPQRTVAAYPAAESLAAAPIGGAADKQATKQCPDCVKELPSVARFCFNCGYPQPEEEPSAPVGVKAPEEEFLVLEELPDLKEVEPTNKRPDFLGRTAPASPVTETSYASTAGKIQEKEQANGSGRGAVKKERSQRTIPGKTWTLSELKIAFREHLQERLLAYFGDRKLKTFYRRLEEHSGFQALRDGSLTNLMNWLNEGTATRAAAQRRLRDTLADLTEYFVVETAGDLSDSVLPQRLLRHQSVAWETADIFKVVMDYLDFENETERVYTDFVTMPSRALRNATKSFLQAKKDERIYFICDQSLISQAKNGFAVTDAGLYWKNVLQPAGVITFTTLGNVNLAQGHLQLDGQFFNAGAKLNLKMAVLLDRLRRM